MLVSIFFVCWFFPLLMFVFSKRNPFFDEGEKEKMLEYWNEFIYLCVFFWETLSVSHCFMYHTTDTFLHTHTEWINLAFLHSTNSLSCSTFRGYQNLSPMNSRFFCLSLWTFCSWQVLRMKLLHKGVNFKDSYSIFVNCNYVSKIFVLVKTVLISVLFFWTSSSYEDFWVSRRFFFKSSSGFLLSASE